MSFFIFIIFKKNFYTFFNYISNKFVLANFLKFLFSTLSEPALTGIIAVSFLLLITLFIFTSIKIVFKVFDYIFYFADFHIWEKRDAYQIFPNT